TVRRMAVDGVVVVEVGERLRVGQVVDADDLEIADLPLDHRAHNAAPDPPKSIDANLRGHYEILSVSGARNTSPVGLQRQPDRNSNSQMSYSSSDSSKKQGRRMRLNAKRPPSAIAGRPFGNEAASVTRSWRGS